MDIQRRLERLEKRLEATRRLDEQIEALITQVETLPGGREAIEAIIEDVLHPRPPGKMKPKR